MFSLLLTIVLALAPTQSPTAAPSQSPTDLESDTCDWVALRSDECPSDNGSSLGDCHENMAVGDLCEADSILPNGKYFFNIDNCGGYDVFRFECGRRPTGAPTGAPTAEPTRAPTQSPTNPRSEVVCDGSYGTYDCVCEDSRVKLATLAPRLVRLNGRRKMAIRGEEAYCEGANTCMFEQEVEPGFTGGISNYRECVHLKSWETYDVMSYFPSDGDQLPEDASTHSCTDYFFECAVSAGGYVNLGTGECRAEDGGYFDRYYGFGTKYECEDLCAANIECLGYAIYESNPDKCHLYVPDDVTFSKGIPSGFTYSHTSHDGTYITWRYITGAFSGDFALGCMKKPADPTKELTANPTNQPTKVPTSKPSRCPTRTPTANSMSPSLHPTGTPSTTPSTNPTASPNDTTSSPSRTPTSMASSMKPSFDETTQTPSASPSLLVVTIQTSQSSQRWPLFLIFVVMVVIVGGFCLLWKPQSLKLKAQSVAVCCKEKKVAKEEQARYDFAEGEDFGLPPDHSGDCKKKASG